MEKKIKPLILYIDDEASNLKVISFTLRKDFKVITCQDPLKAEEIIEKIQEISLVLSDQFMPKLEGVELLKRIKKKYEDLPCVLVSAHSDFEILKDGLNNAQIDRFISKPIDKENVKSIINLLIDSYELKRRNRLYRRELIRSEEKYRNIFLSIPDLWIRVTLEGTIIMANPAVEKHLGYKAEELIGKQIKELYFDYEDREEILDNLKEEKVKEFDNKLVTKSGKVKVFRSSSKKVIDSDGQIIIESLLKDITNEYHLKEKLEIQSALLKVSQKAAKVASVYIEINSDQVLVTKEFKRTFKVASKYKSDTISLAEFLELFQGNYRDRMREVIQKSIEDYKPFNVESRIQIEEKGIYYIRASGTIFHDDYNKVEVKNPILVIACLDITYEVENQIDLIESKNNFESILEQSPSPIFQVDRNLVVEYANSSAEAISVKLFKAAMSFKKEIKKIDPVIEQKVKQVFETGKSEKLQIHNSYQRYFPEWLFVLVNPVKEKSKINKVLLIFTDVTAVKKAETVLQNANEALETKVKERTKELEQTKADLEKAIEKEKQLSKMKSQFVATASHQFRTPLTVIQSSMGLLGLYLNKIENEAYQEKFDGLVERVNAEIERMTSLMNEVLVLGKKESGKIYFEGSNQDVLKICDSLKEQYDHIQKDGRELELKVSGSASSSLYTDPSLFENAISNLVSNAFKYSEKSERNPELHCILDEDKVEIMVRDYGIGIPESEIDNVFDSFYRASNTSEINGTGLGMSIVRAYTDLLEAEISCVSEVNEGTTFNLVFKRKKHESKAVTS